ncbi:MAG: hypothetical protein AAFX79_13555 [Planctomycetota bacterium]
MGTQSVTIRAAYIRVAGALAAALVLGLLAWMARSPAGQSAVVTGDGNQVEQNIGPSKEAIAKLGGIERDVDRQTNIAELIEWRNRAERKFLEYEGPADYAISVMSSAVDLGLSQGKTPGDIIQIFQPVYTNFRMSVDEAATELEAVGVPIRDHPIYAELERHYAEFEAIGAAEDPSTQQARYAQKKLSSILAVFNACARVAINDEYARRHEALKTTSGIAPGGTPSVVRGSSVRVWMLVLAGILPLLAECWIRRSSISNLLCTTRAVAHGASPTHPA